MAPDDWNTPWAKAIGMLLSSSADDDNFYIAFNAHCDPVEFTIPPELGRDWRVVLHTTNHPVRRVPSATGISFCVKGHALLVVTQPRIDDAAER